jgi:hypothetical protein
VLDERIDTLQRSILADMRDVAPKTFDGTALVEVVAAP